MNNLFNWLSDWYSNHCNGDWEHSYGIRIKTLDNPGWEISVELSGTEMENIQIPYILHHVSEEDWYGFKTEDNRFVAFGDSHKLEQLILLFKHLVENRLEY